MVRREIGKRYVDSTYVDVRVMHGVCYLRGYIKQLRGHDNIDLGEELEVIPRILRQRPGIREVICELDIGGPGLRYYVKSSQKGKDGI
jgi:hypothetical protein